MGTIPVLKLQEVVRILMHLALSKCASVAAPNSFIILNSRATTVPFHKGRDIAPTLLCKITRDIGLTVQELLAHR